MIKDIFWGKHSKYITIGIGLVTTVLISSKILYDYSIYSDLKYIKKKLHK